MQVKISLENASFSYGQKTIFSGLNFEVGRGEILCILGANGCGKTTLLNCLNGTLKLKTGKVTLNGNNLSNMGIVEVARRVGFVFQEHNAPFPFSVLEVVRMGRAPHLNFFASPSKNDTEIALRALDLVGMAQLRDNPYTQISGGERQLVLIARTLAQEPEVIIMDEPTSHLDFKNQTLVLRMIIKMASQGISIIMSTHLPDHAMLLSGKVALMSNGSFITIGSIDAVMTESNLRETYGIDVRYLSVYDQTSGKTIKFCMPAIETNSQSSGINR